MTVYWEDLNIDDTFNSDKNLFLTAEEIIEFASQFDPQPYHLDPVAAEASIFGGLCASGWQISAMAQRMITDCFHIRKISILGLSGVKQLQWKKAAFAGDSLSIEMRLIDKNPESYLSDVGVVEMECTVRNQKEDTIIFLINSLLIARKEAGND